jgi:hypothetical protein
MILILRFQEIAERRSIALVMKKHPGMIFQQAHFILALMVGLQLEVLIFSEREEITEIGKQMQI